MFLGCVQNFRGCFRAHGAHQQTERQGGPHLRGRGKVFFRAQLIAHGHDARMFAFDADDACAEQELRSGSLRGFGQPLGNLSIAAPRIKKPSGARRLQPRNCFGHLAQDLGDGIARNSFARLCGRQFFRRQPPELARVRKIKLAANGAPEAAFQHGGKGFRAAISARELLANHVGSDAESERLGQAQQEVAGLEREVNPAILEADAAVAWAIEQIVSQQGAQIVQNSGITRGMQAVAAIIHPDSVELEAARVAADGLALFQHGDAGQACARELICGSYARGAGPEDDDVGMGIVRWHGRNQ